MSESKQKYIEFCIVNGSRIPVFMHPWYIDAVLPNGEWDVALHFENDIITGCLIYQIERKFRLVTIKNVPLSPCVNPVIFVNDKLNNFNKRRKQNEIIKGLFNNVIRFDTLKLKLNYDILDTRPLIWDGYNVSVRYSSMINKLSDYDIVKANFKSSLKSDLKKAVKNIQVFNTQDADLLYKLISKTFKRKNKDMPISLSSFQDLTDNCSKSNCLHSYVAQNQNGEYIGCIVCIEGIDTVFYMFGGVDNTVKQSAGAQALLIESAIKDTISLSKNFDFEGSMIPSVSKFFMAFYPDIQPYYFIEKTNSMLLKVKNVFKN